MLEQGWVGSAPSEFWNGEIYTRYLETLWLMIKIFSDCDGYL
jgi:hypothetical protein